MSTVFNRVRSKDETIWFHPRGIVSQYNSTDKTWTPLQNYEKDSVLRVVTETMHDQVTPGGHGPFPDRACYHSKVVTERNGTANVCTIYPYGETAFEGSLACSEQSELAAIRCVASPPDGAFPDLKSQVLEGLDPAATVLAGLPFIGEFHQVVKMIRNPFSFLSRLPKASRHTKLGQHLRNLGLGPTSDAWLQYNYGWRPLMGDLSSVAGLLASCDESFQEYKNGSERRKASVSSVYAQSENSESYSQGKITSRITYIARFDLTYRLKPAAETGNAMSRSRFVAQKLGLTPAHLASAAWELVPYSFVSDWFLPVGSFLKGLSSTPVNLEIIRQNYHDTHIEENTEYQWLPSLLLGGKAQTPQKQGSSRATTTVTDYWRNVENHGPTPEFLGSGMSSRRTISALALIAQKLMMPIRK